MHKWPLFVLLSLTITGCGAHEPRPDPQPDKQAPIQANDANEAYQAKQNAEAERQAEESADADESLEGEEAIAERMADEHEGDTPTASDATKPAPAQEVVTREVAYFSRAGEPITGYLAHPKGETEDLPAILVVHEWWGLNDNIRAMTRRLAGEGYVALAVDLYNGEVAEEPDKARKIMSKVMQNKEGALTNLSAARRWLEDEHSPSKLGIIGWCFGGGWALRGALNMKDNVDAVVMYYGEVITDESMLADLSAPLMGIFGADDKAVSPENVREFQAKLDELDKPADINIYDGVGHAFANPSGDNYDKAAADKAWQQTLRFFKEHLRQ
jgi:carboxymethylenebutenolidase